MRTLVLILLFSGVTLAPTFAQSATAGKQAPATKAPAAPAKPPMRNIGTMSDLMVKILYPSSDALFYVETRTPTTESEWTVLQGQALMVAETANLLMLPGRARDQKQWMADSKLLLDAGAAAYKAAKDKDVPGISAVSDQLLESCTSCHKHYRPGYGQKP
jgi:hypothetical protein